MTRMSSPSGRPPLLPAPEVERAARMLNHGDSVSILIGGGARCVDDSVAQLASTLGAPILFSAPAVTAETSSSALSGSHVVLLIGGGADSREELPAHFVVIHLVAHEARLGRLEVTDLGLVGDVGDIVVAIQPLIARRPLDVDEYGVIGCAAEVIDALAEDNCIVVLDVDAAAGPFAHRIGMRRTRRIVRALEPSEGECALSVARRAQAADVDRQVVVVMCADASASVHRDLIRLLGSDLAVKVVMFERRPGAADGPRTISENVRAAFDLAGPALVTVMHDEK
jgi:thiamine pyrophosphate-dependent acetolactate synthase large subunit-like protein